MYDMFVAATGTVIDLTGVGYEILDETVRITGSYPLFRIGLPYPPYYGWESPKIPPVWGVVKNASGGVTPPGDSSPKWVGVRTEWGGVQEESKFSNFK